MLRPLAMNAVKWANALRNATEEDLPAMEPAYHPLATDKSTPLDCDEGGRPRRHAAVTLRLPVGMVNEEPCAIVLREHTRQVLDEAVKHLTMRDGVDHGPGPSLLVTGSPGIGKSMGFLPGLVRRLLLGHVLPLPPVIVIEDRSEQLAVKLRVDGSCVVTDAEVVSLQTYCPAEDLDLRSPSTVYIVDPTSDGALVGSPARKHARTVVVASPNADNFKDFKKRRPGPKTLYMQPWSLDELRAARLLCDPDPSATDAAVIERWQQQGGNPRIAYAAPEEVEDAIFRTQTNLSAVSESVLANLMLGLRQIRLNEKGTDGANSSIIAYQSEAPFTKPRTVFISDVVRDLVVDAHFGRIMHLITTAPSGLRSQCGSVFERLASRRLASASGASLRTRIRALRTKHGTARLVCSSTRVVMAAPIVMWCFSLAVAAKPVRVESSYWP